MTSPLMPEQMLDLAGQLDELVRQAESGQLTASASMTAMLRGAHRALLVANGHGATPEL